MRCPSRCRRIVAAGISPSGITLEHHETAGVIRERWGVREVLSAGLGSPALRQARMPAATTAPKQFRDLHIELKVKQ
ncbi:MAG TPA: hypothetical protein VK327_11400 [Candidatus Paceibacterota bacterium]|nr:hypothetical protein [Candidatus Paceibacterota bacterium]